MKKIILGIMVFGFVGLVCGSARGQIAENIIKLKKSGNCKGCFLEKANLEGADLKGVNLEGAKLKGANLERANLEKANLKGTNREFDDKNFYRLSVARLIQQRTKSKVQKTKKR